MFVYWGSYMSGKFELICNSLVNECGVVQFLGKYIKFRSNPIVVSDDLKVEYDNLSFFRESKNSKISCDKKRILLDWSDETAQRSATLEKQYSRICNDQKQTFNELVDNFPQWKGDVYTFPCNLKSMGVDKQYLLSGMKQAAKYPHITRQIFSFPHKHIVPFRKFTSPHSLLHRIELFNPKSTPFYNECDSIFELYDKDKDKFFQHIKNFDRHTRDLEQVLVDAGVEYEYFDLDNDSYSDVFNWKVSLEHNFTKPKFNLDNPIVLEKYNKSLDMCQDYLDTFNITDTRLEYRSKDGI